MKVQSIRELKSLFSVSMKITRAIIFHRFLNLISISVDILMIYLIKEYGFWFEMTVMLFPFYAICVLTIILYDYFLDRGHDLLFLDYFCNLRDQKIERRRIFTRLTQWILKRRTSIFLLGSFWLEPDITTILLRKDKKGLIRNAVYITLPSTIICVTSWSIIFYYGVKGYEYFKWLL